MEHVGKIFHPLFQKVHVKMMVWKIFRIAKKGSE